MDITEIRRANLKRLVDASSNQREFADKAGLAPAYVSQMVNGTRNIGEKTARKIEAAIGLDAGRLDDLDHPPALDSKNPLYRDLIQFASELQGSDLEMLVFFAKSLTEKATSKKIV